MRISELIPPDDIILDVAVRDKDQALAVIAEELSEDRMLDAERVRAALAAREALGSTGVGKGIALPHVRLPELDKSRALFMRVKPAIDFESIDGKPVDLICAVISPISDKDESDAPLKILAAFSRLLKDKTNAEELRQARTVSAVTKIFLRSDTQAAGSAS